MPRLSIAISLLGVCLSSCLCLFAPTTVRADEELVAIAPADWPWWRGSNRNGIAAADQKPPLTWSETENVVWKMPVPGKGHGSPIVVGEHVYLQTAEQDRDAQ